MNRRPPRTCIDPELSGYVVPTMDGQRLFHSWRWSERLSKHFWLLLHSQTCPTVYNISLRFKCFWEQSCRAKQDAVIPPVSPNYTSLMRLSMRPVITGVSSNNWVAVLKYCSIYSSGLRKGKKNYKLNLFVSVVFSCANVFNIYKCWTFFFLVCLWSRQSFNCCHVALSSVCVSNVPWFCNNNLTGYD